MDHKISVPFYFSAPFFVVVNLVRVECQSGESEQGDRRLVEIPDIFAFWQRHLCWFRGRSLRGGDLWTKDPVPG
jgi:hypothetical protein